MTALSWLILYSVLVLIASLLGGAIPFVGRVTHNRLQFYISLSAGIMLGASFFHVMPDAMETAGAYFGWWMSLGVIGLFCIERFIAPHSHEVDNGHHKHDHGHDHHGHEHAHDHRAAAPAIAGWMAVLGLTIHTFLNGVGLAGAVTVDLNEKHELFSNVWLAFPGLAMFIAIVAHKPADALAISTVLSRKGVSRQLLGLVQFGFALMVFGGALAFVVLGEFLAGPIMKQVTGAALAFSAGTFLFVALSDLLPEVQFHRHDRIPLFLSLAAGVLLMGVIGLLEGHDDKHGDEHTHATTSRNVPISEGLNGAETRHNHADD